MTRYTVDVFPSRVDNDRPERGLLEAPPRRRTIVCEDWLTLERICGARFGYVATEGGVPGVVEPCWSLEAFEDLDGPAWCNGCGGAVGASGCACDG